MARRSRMSILKRQRELKKSEKAARKRARRHGIREPLFREPEPTITSEDLVGGSEPSDEPTDHDEVTEPDGQDND